MTKKIFIGTIFFFLSIFFFLNTGVKVFASSSDRFSTDQILLRLRPALSMDERLSFHRILGVEKVSQINNLGIDVLKIKSGDIQKIIDTLHHDPRVEFVEPDYIAYALEQTNDPSLVSSQWNLYKIQAAGTDISAWNYSKSNQAVKIAILDTGIDGNHEDLKAKIAVNKNCTDSNSTDDKYGHGTHVAGIAAAATNNSIGVAGVGYNAALMNVKVLADNGSGYYSWISNCLIWAADNGAKIVSLSLGGSSPSTTLESAINYAWSKGVVIVAAAGNDGTSSPVYPAYYNNVISVAATDANDQKPAWSSYGQWVSVAAPGVSIYSTLPNHRNSIGTVNYGSLSGTSMATPHVAGLASLLFSFNNMDNVKVRNFIQNYADQISGTGTYWTYGRINALKSVAAAGSLNIVPTSASTPTPSPTLIPIPTATPTSVSWWCKRYPTFCH